MRSYWGSALHAATAYISAQPEEEGHDPIHRGSPVGRAFTLLTLAIAATVVLTGIETGRNPGSDRAAGAGQLAVTATTVFAITGLLVAYRSATTRSPRLAPLAAAMVAVGAGWAWLAAVQGRRSTGLAVVVAVVAGGVALVMVAEGRRRSRWLGLFCGLAMVGVASAAVLTAVEPRSVSTVSLALLLVVSAAAGLYGTVAELEQSERRSLKELLAAKDSITERIAETEAVLHDLRSGLLAIETTIGTLDSDLAPPLKAEAARLRRLSARRQRNPSEFDVVVDLRNLVRSRRAAGTVVDLRVPGSARVAGERSEVMAMVDNLLSNAIRHGRPPALIEVNQIGRSVEIAVADGGRVDSDVSPHLFQPGYTTHPDGEGIGLARVRMLAELNRATVDFEPADDGATRFVLRLPCSLDAPAIQPPAGNPPAGNPPAGTVPVIDMTSSGRVPPAGAIHDDPDALRPVPLGPVPSAYTDGPQ